METYPTKRAYATGKLYKFLKEKGAYSKFVNNVIRKNKHYEERGYTIIRGLKTANDLLGAFGWEDTPEGNKYWSIIYKELSEQT